MRYTALVLRGSPCILDFTFIFYTKNVLEIARKYYPMTERLWSAITHKHDIFLFCYERQLLDVYIISFQDISVFTSIQNFISVLFIFHHHCPCWCKALPERSSALDCNIECSWLANISYCACTNCHNMSPFSLCGGAGGTPPAFSYYLFFSNS